MNKKQNGSYKYAPELYHHDRTPQPYTREEAEAAVGKRATLVLTGTIVRADNSANGDYVIFKVDERFGMAIPPKRFLIGMDLDAFEVEE